MMGAGNSSDKATWIMDRNEDCLRCLKNSASKSHMIDRSVDHDDQRIKSIADDTRSVYIRKCVTCACSYA